MLRATRTPRGSRLSDAERPWAWKYRDYVIRSLNADKPFDRFITEQLAGDELAGPANGDWSPEQIELLTATGFLRMAADGTGSGDNSPEARNKVVADTLQIVGSSLLGLSLNCAQCHDHRYDPISQVDYYAIRSVFEPALDWQKWKSPDSRRVSLYTAADREQAAEIEKQAGGCRRGTSGQAAGVHAASPRKGTAEVRRAAARTTPYWPTRRRTRNGPTSRRLF